METNENDIQQDLCRLCNCEADENSEMFSVFDKNEEGQEIINLIQECLHLIVCRTDPLSKSVCAECLQNLNNLYKFKKKTLEVANKHKEKLRTNGDNDDESVEVFLSYEKENNVDSESSEQGEKPLENSENPEDDTKTVDAATSTEDINILCNNCQAEILGAHKVNNELELCAELHQAIADSFTRNKIVSSDKTLRSKRKRSQAFYHELDDSLCSSLTEFTNTESSQCFEFQSDSDSVGEDDDDSRPPKRRKMDNSKEPVVQTPEVSFETKFETEDEYRYNPLSLLQLCLNVINKENIPEYEPDDFYEELVEPKCSYCGKTYRNSKLLALHEVTHMSIELGEKVDNPIPWHESRDDAYIRNKWLTSEDDIVEEDSYIENETMESEAIEIEPEEEEESLLIPVGSAEQRDGQNYEVTREVNLIDGKPYVDGLPLSDYPKEERRAFYHSMRIGKVNKRFCALCRYSFKDNWAIESHYFSMACYYTCRYCGMRFNKQRNRFEEHLEVHIKNNHEYSKKVFAASKNNNIVPKVLLPRKRYSAKDNLDVMLPQPIEVRDYTPISKKLMTREFKCQQESVEYCPPSALLVRDYTPISKKGMKPEFKVKQEPLDYCPPTSLFEQTQQMQQPQLQTSQMKTGNQAYFCRKCYKVFFKLDEFNVHSRNCDFNQFSGIKAQNVEATQTTNSGRPVRNCAKEAGPYRDELYIPEHLLKDQVHTSSSQGPYICYICNTPFPTIYSRNSHMRIHKAENIRDTPPSTLQQQPNKYRSVYQESNQFQKTSVAHLAQVKQEPLDLEPEVEIHEQTTQDNYSANISPSVSITPIRKNPNQKTQINANVMKLVQNNPQLSIKNRDTQQQNHNQQMQQQQIQYQQMMGGPADDRTYKCSSCWEAFANKSHLYFHKKNQCEGSKYPCPFCKKRFGTEAAYSSHIFYSHPE